MPCHVGTGRVGPKTPSAHPPFTIKQRLRNVSIPLKVGCAFEISQKWIQERTYNNELKISTLTLQLGDSFIFIADQVCTKCHITSMAINTIVSNMSFTVQSSETRVSCCLQSILLCGHVAFKPRPYISHSCSLSLPYFSILLNTVNHVFLLSKWRPGGKD